MNDDNPIDSLFRTLRELRRLQKRRRERLLAWLIPALLALTIAGGLIWLGLHS